MTQAERLVRALRKGCGRPWTTEEDALLVERFPHVRTAIIATELGRSVGAAGVRAYSLGLTKTAEARSQIWRDAPRKGAAPKHGSATNPTPTYKSWRAMKTRCLNSKARVYAAYGGKGIKICERWNDFSLFVADMGERPPGTSLDRYPNGAGNYEPGNCRWATASEQNRNRVTSRMLTHDGLTLNLVEWAARTGLNAETITTRLRLGWPVGLALTAPRKFRPKWEAVRDGLVCLRVARKV